MSAQVMFQPMYPKEFVDPLFLRELLGERPKLITLENGTCTYRAAIAFQAVTSSVGIDLELVEVPSFETTVDLLGKASTDHLAITPCLHEVSRELGHDKRFWPTKAIDFILSNPPIYLANRKDGKLPNDLPIEGRRVATIKPLKSLISDETLQVIGVDSTQVAAKQVALGIEPFCITNEEGVLRNDLRVLDTAPNMHMLWRFHKKVPF